MKKANGFTLVEVIVVMAILAILAALFVPALTKYIDTADKISIKSEAKYVLTAAQTTASEFYAQAKTKTMARGSNLQNYLNSEPVIKEIMELSEMPGELSDIVIHDGETKIGGFTYISSGITITYDSENGFSEPKTIK